MDDYSGAKGFLIIGDIHLASKRPERRKDDYAQAILAKVSECIAIANRDMLIPVVLGDIYHRPVESSEEIKTELLEILASSWVVPICNIGNHDISGDFLQKSDSFAYLKASKIIHSNIVSGPVGEFIINDVCIGIGMTPYGQKIPVTTEGMFPNADGVVWFTHHDMAFEGAYPKSQPLHVIKGCGLAINGHIHLTKPIMVVGETTWCNFGSIARTAVDAKDHVPIAVAFYPTKEDIFVYHELEHEKDVFDLTGRMVTAMPADGGNFAQMIVDELMSDAAKTDSGTIFLEELNAFLQSDRNPMIHSSIIKLYQKALENT